MKNSLFIALFVTLLCSCGKKINAKIEERENDKVYIVNTSTDRSFKFTVKTTTITNDTMYDYETSQVELAPGGEFLLGTNKAMIDQDLIKPKFDPSKDYEQIPMDTLAIGGSYKPKLPGIEVFYAKVSYKYEVTGQQELKQSPKK